MTTRVYKTEELDCESAEECQPETIYLFADGSSGDAELELAMAQVMEKAFELFKKKQASYGPGNISEFGEKGVLIRANDKMQRLLRLVWDGIPNPLEEAIEDSAIVCRLMDKLSELHNIPECVKRELILIVLGEVSAQKETIDDTWMDLAVYALIAILVREGSWPE